MDMKKKKAGVANSYIKQNRFQKEGHSKKQRRSLNNT